MDRRPVLSDASTDAALVADGFTTMAFLSASEVDHLCAAHDALVPRGESGVQLDFVREDRELVRRLTKELLAVLEPRIDAAFCDHFPVLPSFIVKHPGPGTDFYLHRDVPVHDESRTRCVTVWIPLVDVGLDHANGGLAVVPGSQDLPYGDHGFDATVLVEPYEADLRRALRPLDLRAGQALVYDSRVLHASAENRSSAPRPAIGCLVARRSEPLTHVVPTGRHGRRRHAIDRDFFVDHHPAEIVQHGMPAGYPVVEEFEDRTEVRPDDLRRTLGIEVGSACVTVPEDLRDPGFASSLLSTHRSGLTPPAHDVTIEADDLEALPPELDGGWAARGRGVVEHLRLSGGAARRRNSLGALHGSVGAWTRFGRAVELVVLRPGSRLMLAPDATTPLEVATLDAPRVRAGLGTPTGVASLEPGRAVYLQAPATVWNDGPGPAVLVARPANRRRRAKG